MPNIGEVAPDFELKDQSGEIFKLSERLKGHVGVVAFFYPKDNTGVCTAEVCHFRDQNSELEARKFLVVGISSDSVTSHRAFASKYGVRYSLLSDESGVVRKLWKVPALLGLIPGRVTYVLDQNRVVVGLYNNALDAASHTRFALEQSAKIEAQ